MLIHRWPLTAGPEDMAGGLHLTNNGSVTFSGAGASFNGTNQWLSAVKLPPSSVTMSVWITPVDFSARRSTFVISDSGNSNSLSWSDDGNRTNLIVYFGSSSYISVAGELTLTNYPADRKTLSVVTYDRSQSLCSVYRNTTLLATSAVSATVSSTALSLGRFGAYAACYWYGTMADARLYDHALTRAEVESLWLAGPNGGTDVFGSSAILPNATILSAPLGAGDRRC